VAVISRAHFLDLDEFSSLMLQDNLTACSNYIFSVHEKDEEAVWPVWLWNYMPPSAGSIIHPHSQVLVEREPLPVQARILQESREYYEQNGRNYWDELAERERELGERFIYGNDSLSVIASFAPRGFNEIQFTFWLIIGLAITFIRIRESGFYSGGHDLEYRIPERGKAALDVIKRVSLDKDRKIGLALVILIFAGSLFYSSWSELSINIRQKEVGWENYYGYYHEEVIGGRTIRWISKDAGTIIEKEGEKLIVPVKDADPAGHLLPLFIRFFVDNRMVKVVKISDKQWQDVEIDLSGYGEEQFTFTISCSRSWVPKERGLSNDTRELGVMTGEFEFVR